MDSDPSFEKNQLEGFTEKRQALERLVRLARSLTQISSGLQSLVDLRSETGMTMPGREFLDALSLRLNKIGSDEVLSQMSSLDDRLNQDVATIVALSRADEESIDGKLQDLKSDDKSNTVLSLEEYLEEFQRRAKLAIALRMFLDQQNIKTPSIEFSFSEKDLEQELDSLRVREQICRIEARDRVSSLLEDTSEILNNPAHSQAVKGQIRKIQDQLRESITHIDNGQAIDELPVIIEEVELAPPPFDPLQSLTPDPKAMPRHKPSRAPPEDVEGLDQAEESNGLTDTVNDGRRAVANGGRLSGQQEGMAVRARMPEKPEQSTQYVERPRRFWRALVIWLTTPVSVSWQQANSMAISEKKS